MDRMKTPYNILHQSNSLEEVLECIFRFRPFFSVRKEQTKCEVSAWLKDFNNKLNGMTHVGCI